MDISRNFRHSLLLLDHHLVLAAQGLYRPTLTEPKLVALLAAGYTMFPFYRFAKFSLERYPHIRISQADISQLVNLPWVLTQFDCSGCLIAANLSGTKLQRARLSNAVLTGSTFQGADLSGALLNGADCREVNFSYAVLHEVNAVRTRFDRAQLHEAISRGGNFSYSSFDGAATERFFISSTVGITPSRYLGGSRKLAEPARISTIQLDKSRSTLGIALARMGNMVGIIHQDLPKLTRMMLDILIFVGLLLAVAKVKEARSQSHLLESLRGHSATVQQLLPVATEQNKRFDPK